MIKNVFSNLSRGIFYTLGKFIAFIILGALLLLLLSKFDIDIPNSYPTSIFDNLFIMNVKAKDISSVFDAYDVSNVRTVSNLDNLAVFDINGAPFANWGLGTLRFNFSIIKVGGSSTAPLVVPLDLTAGNYSCNIGSTSFGNSTFTGSTYSASCPMKIDSRGLTRIVLYLTGNQQNETANYRITMGNMLTFEQDDSVNINLDTSSTTNAINSQITNDNTNTQNIINNDNNNTEEIINNQNENTDKTIESQKACFSSVFYGQDDYSSLPFSGYVDNSGNLRESTFWRTTDYESIPTDGKYFISITQSFVGVSVVFYDSNKSKISAVPLIKDSSMSISIPENASFYRLSLRASDSPIYNLFVCSNGNQAIVDSNKENTDKQIQNNNENTQKVIDSITDDDISDLEDNSSGGGVGHYFDSINQSSSTPITDLLLMPLNLLDKLNDSIGTNSCEPYTIPFDFTGGNNTLTFPCINLGSNNYLGSNLWNTIDILFCGFMVYNIALLIISFYESWSSLSDTFDSLYTPKHTLAGYTPRHTNLG